MEANKFQGARQQHSGLSPGALVHKTKIADAIDEFVVQYGDGGRSEQQLKLLIEQYSKALKKLRWTNSRLDRAVENVMLRSKFFPRIADLVRADEETGIAGTETTSSPHDRLVDESEVNKIFRGADVILKNGKNAKHDYPDYGLPLSELKKMDKEQCCQHAKENYSAEDNYFAKVARRMM